MRLLLLVHGLPVGGTEVMVCHLARRLLQDGVTVAVGCLDELGDLGRGLAAEGIPVEVFGRRPGFDALLPLRIARSVHRRRIDVVHAHQYAPFFYGSLAMVLAGAPLVFTEHGRAYPDLPSARRRVFNHMFAPLTARITAVSRGVRESLHRVEGFNPQGIQVIYNGIDLERYGPRSAESDRAARRRLGLPGAAPVIGTVGRLDPVKDHPLLLAAFRRVRDMCTGAHLVIVGDGPERERLVRLADAMGMAGAVSFLGQRLDVDQILPAFDVFALSSRSEGTPVTLIEAMAAGVPVVATAVGGVPEVVCDRETGLLVGRERPVRGEASTAENEVSTLAGALARVLSDPTLARGLADRGRMEAHERFSLDAICAQYRAIYDELVPARRRPTWRAGAQPRATVAAEPPCVGL